MASSSIPFEGISPQASQPSSTLTGKAPYDVFIHHRGRDVKHKLASTIYYTLKRLGVRAFLDQEELDLGDSIPIALQQAIQGASVHIAILSKNYAQSPWCLAELSLMLKTDAPIIPVFYYVQPGDLRWVAKGKGIYAKDFYQLQRKRRYSSKMLREWKAALQSVSNITGRVLISDNDDEGRVLDEIVNSVLEAVKIVPLEVAKYPVAMDEIVLDFETSTLQARESEQHVQIVGIAGFGGAGKTTFAKELYNRKRSSIKRSSFLTDVRLAATRNALPDKQKKLLQDLRVQNESFDNIHEGKAFLSNRLRSLSESVLIVLDDVDHEDQVDALLPPKDSLAPGSLIIVTTREGDVLRKSGITSVYKMRPLHQSHAEKLFCFHAFLRPSPLEGFDDLAEKFLTVCKGLPLSLKVIGALLYGRNYSKDYWESQLSKIQRILPKDILNTLEVSYEALDEEEKEMFLDVACFFIGEKKSLAIAVWDGSGWSGLCGWEKLFSKCLVEVDEEDCITMHDHLRDLGREIAMTHSPSRLFSPRHRIRIQEGMLLRGIKATCTRWWNRDSYSEQALKECSEMMTNSSPTTGLQLLLVKGNDFTQECAEVCTDLVWLRWLRFPHRNLPSWLSLEKLTVLQLYDAWQLEELWEDEANKQVKSSPCGFCCPKYYQCKF
ncbi:hypothetical protein KI387_033310, partial [Taxus chinensis]